ncbi:hypothetical protein FGW20_03680 [Methanoculleus sp. FWC-SCC3]|uniref:Uncharacterized protein n=1 Tax=Methanoculleus methanifontis TaxID=2584086 RepID=A0ABT8M0D3_9EURY|nr:hypothetical protein [Methanoculleus sp. FWC-SCC3]MDN7012158.1 hypothetical protein [Methanoculleus sp. FWC-SCC3]
MTRVAAVEVCGRALSPGTCRFRIARAVAFVLLFLLAIPFIIGSAFGVSPTAVLALIGSTLLLQAAAAVVGLSLGLHPAAVLLFLTSVAAAALIGILEICDQFAERSRMVQGFLSKIDARTGSIDYLKRYGALMLIPVIWTPGIALYGTPVVAWVFQYPRAVSLLCMLAGWMIAVLVVIAAATGFVRLAF